MAKGKRSKKRFKSRQKKNVPIGKRETLVTCRSFRRCNSIPSNSNVTGAHPEHSSKGLELLVYRTAISLD